VPKKARLVIGGNRSKKSPGAAAEGVRPPPPKPRHVDASEKGNAGVRAPIGAGQRGH
jgi:hypothetical protein